MKTFDTPQSCVDKLNEMANDELGRPIDVRFGQLSEAHNARWRYLITKCLTYDAWQMPQFTVSFDEMGKTLKIEFFNKNGELVYLNPVPDDSLHRNPIRI